MSEVNISRDLPAPPEVIFDMLANSETYRKLNSSNMLIVYDRIEELPGGGFEMFWRYTALGMPVKLHTKTEELTRPSRFTVRTEGPINAFMTIDLNEIPKGTRLDLHITFESGDGVLGMISGPFASNQMEYSVATLLRNIELMLRDR
jgi:hypothetical protein